MKKNFLFLISVLLLIFVLYVFRAYSSTGKVTRNSGRIKVVASFYPLYDFSKKIGGGKIDLSNLTPAGAEPHDFEPSAKDVAELEKIQLLVLNGAGLEAWGGRVAKSLENKGVRVVLAAEGLAENKVSEGSNKVFDPHVWLSPILAKQEAQKISEALINVDSKNKSIYQTNNSMLQEEFDVLDKEFRDGLKDCKQKNIVTSHAAFGYLASTYGFNQIAISGLSPDSEPSPKTLAGVALLAKKEGIKYILFETLVSPKLAETIASEVGAKTIVFNPLEGLTNQEISGGEDYFTVQHRNLNNLKIALECK